MDYDSLDDIQKARLAAQNIEPEYFNQRAAIAQNIKDSNPATRAAVLEWFRLQTIIVDREAALVEAARQVRAISVRQTRRGVLPMNATTMKEALVALDAALKAYKEKK